MRPNKRLGCSKSAHSESSYIGLAQHRDGLAVWAESLPHHAVRTHRVADDRPISGQLVTDRSGQHLGGRPRPHRTELGTQLPVARLLLAQLALGLSTKVAQLSAPNGSVSHSGFYKRNRHHGISHRVQTLFGLQTAMTNFVRTVQPPPGACAGELVWRRDILRFRVGVECVRLAGREGILQEYCIDRREIR